MTPEQLDEFVRAVSNASRRQILQICSEGYVAAGDIAAEIDLALASVSEHLKVLRKTGLLDLERDGTRWLYRANREAVSQVLDALHEDLTTTSSDRPVR